MTMTPRSVTCCGEMHGRGGLAGLLAQAPARFLGGSAVPEGTQSSRLQGYQGCSSGMAKLALELTLTS